MKHKIFTVLFVVFLSFMCISNIVSNIDAVNEKFSEDSLSFSTLKSAILFVRDTDTFNAPFKKQYIEANGLFHRINGKRFVHDAGNNHVTKLSNGHISLSSLEEYILESKKAAEYVTEFNKFAKQENIDFLYISAPNKLYKNNHLAISGVYPKYGDTSEFLSIIEKNDVNCINIAEEFETEGIDMYDFYFKTDHHWTPEGAFFAFQKTCEFMKNEYGYEIDSKFTNINEYTIDTYEDYFVGSAGTRTGSLYSGKDDFSLIYPNFQTQLSLTDADIFKEGNFYDVMFDLEKLNETFVYCTYLGYDTPLKTIKNFNSTSDKKIMLIRDSFGSTFAPYLSLICKELYIVDMRIEPMSDCNIMSYAKELGVDTVIVLYSNSTIMDVDLVLDFNKQQLSE